MTTYDACELSFKNGYDAGYHAAMNDVLDHYNKFNLSIPDLIDMILRGRYT